MWWGGWGCDLGFTISLLPPSHLRMTLRALCLKLCCSGYRRAARCRTRRHAALPAVRRRWCQRVCGRCTMISSSPSCARARPLSSNATASKVCAAAGQGLPRVVGVLCCSLSLQGSMHLWLKEVCISSCTRHLGRSLPVPCSSATCTKICLPDRPAMLQVWVMSMPSGPLWRPPGIASCQRWSCCSSRAARCAAITTSNDQLCLGWHGWTAGCGAAPLTAPAWGVQASEP